MPKPAKPRARKRSLLSRIFGRRRAAPLQLSDTKEDIYVWIVRKGQAPEITEWINDLYVEQYGRPPIALHICVEQVKDIQQFSRDELRQLIRPWMEGG